MEKDFKKKQDELDTCTHSPDDYYLHELQKYTNLL